MIDLDFDLTDEERALRDTVHAFAAEVMRPAGEELDRLPDPAQVVAPDSVLWEVFRRHRELGLDEITAATDLTPVQQVRMRCIVSDELGWGDAGLAISLGVSGFPRNLALMSGHPELIERFGGGDVIGCWPITEPDHGSDVLVNFGDLSSQHGAPNCVARKDGDSFVVNGQKSAWVSNGTIATAAALFCAVDLGDGPAGMGALVVPLDAPGVTRGKPLDKIGQRALNQGEIFFQDVRLPAHHLVVSPEVAALAKDMVLCQANGGMGLVFAGLARAALEMAVDYAKERVQGGVPIIRHQSVRARLFEMYRKVAAARALARHAALTTAVAPRVELAVASKVTATQTAFEVASGALQIFGGNGLSREYPIEKLLRDARASMVEDGCNEVLGLVAAERL
ncbi:MAG: acyl-CoA/acyl-ACP dehydrogenase [Acidimicrobiia bacterium]|nr:acyl-CoA/acyl-ACP dehydrogenase [Acidimicrobiia bacterium]